MHIVDIIIEGILLFSVMSLVFGGLSMAIYAVHWVRKQL